MPNDLEKLQGTWNVTSVVMDGQEMPLEADGSRIVVKGNRFTSLGMGATYEGTLELDQKKTPKTFDLVFTAGHAAGTRNVGIYTLDGKSWTICLATRGTRRPRSFASRAGTGVALETLVRGRVGGKKEKAASVGKRGASGRAADRRAVPQASTGAATILEGEWAMVSAVFNGAPMGDDMVKWCKRITRGDETSVVAGPQVMLKARFTLDASTAPHRIDYVNLEPPNKGKTQAGIFALSGGTLSICMAAPGKPRPGDFGSAPGDGRSYTTWRRLAVGS